MTPDELKTFVGSDLQKALVTDLKRELAAAFIDFLQMAPDQLEGIRAKAAARYDLLLRFSLDADDLKQLSQDEIELMEQLKAEQELALRKMIDDRRAQASRALR